MFLSTICLLITVAVLYDSNVKYIFLSVSGRTANIALVVPIRGITIKCSSPIGISPSSSPSLNNPFPKASQCLTLERCMDTKS